MSFAIGHIGNELKSNSINVQTIITSTQTTTTTTTTTKTNTTNNNNTIYVITNTKCNECATNSIYVSLDHQNPPPTTVPLIHRSTDPLPQSPMPPNHEFVYEKKKKQNIYISTHWTNQIQPIIICKMWTKIKWNQSKSEMESQSNRINQHIELIDQINQTIDQQCRLQMINHLNKSNQIQSHACVCVCPATVSVNQPRARTYTHA